MGTARLNVWIRNKECNLLESCWRTDLIIKTCCSGKYLIDLYPEIVDQLKRRYGTPAHAKCTSAFPLTTDQTGKTISFQVGSGTAQILTFASPALTLAEVYAQMAAYFDNVDIDIDDGLLCVTSKENGPDAILTIGGDSDLIWGPIKQGDGWQIKTHFYHGHWRIMFYPGGGKTLNHLELDVPTGTYLIQTRVCHGENEETNLVYKQIAKCDGHYCVDLLLPAIKTCAAELLHPMMDRIVADQFLIDDAERLLPFRALMYYAGVGKADVQAQLQYRYQEADEKGDDGLKARVLAVQNLAALLPECY